MTIAQIIAELEQWLINNPNASSMNINKVKRSIMILEGIDE